MSVKAGFLLLLAADFQNAVPVQPPLPVRPSVCGDHVTGTYFKKLLLKNSDGAVVQRLPTNNGRLLTPLKVIGCGKFAVIVEFEGQPLAADRWRVIFDRKPQIECRVAMAGTEEAATQAATLNSFEPLICVKNKVK